MYREGKIQALVFAILTGLTSGVMSYMYAIAFRVGGYLVENGEMNSENMYRFVRYFRIRNYLPRLSITFFINI